jgi:aspartokinase/homoserine dehydrogenase 1
MIVMKFGGTSVGDGEMIYRTAEIVHNVALERPVVAVVSAMSGVTDALIRGATSAERRDAGVSRRIADELTAKHRRAIETVVSDQETRGRLLAHVESLLADFTNLCQAIAVLGELTPRGLDVVSSLGERLSAPIVAAAVSGLGTPAEAVEASRLIVTNGHHGNATPLMDKTIPLVREQLLPLTANNVVPIVTGFIATTAEGEITTLGRGGSDYTAAILGQCLGSEEIWIWTDVDGVMTADPRIVPEARSLPEISYAEAAELSFFGAKVLHPRTMLPAMEAGIPLRILNTFNPTHPGTLVVAEGRPGQMSVKGITAIRDLSLITVEGRGMVGVPGVAAKVFGAVAQEGISVLMISQSSSEQNICFVIQEQARERALQALDRAFVLERARRDIERIWAKDGVAIVAVVGAGMLGTPGISGKVFGALGSRNINVVSIAQGSSEYNISLVVDGGDADEAVRTIHQEFALDAL